MPILWQYLRKKALGRLKICPKCAKLFRLNSKDRVKTIADENSFVEFDINMEAKDPLNFLITRQRLSLYRKDRS